MDSLLKIVYVLFLLISGFVDTEKVRAQVVKTNCMLSSNWSNNGYEKIYKITYGVGFESFESKKIIVSSNFGLNYKGQQYPIYNGSMFEANIQYLELNTTIRYKIPMNSMCVFVGIGPSINWRIKSEYNVSGEIDDCYYRKGEFRTMSNMVELLFETGLYKDLGRIRTELFVSYRNNMTKVIPETRTGFIGHSLLFNISLGYKF